MVLDFEKIVFFYNEHFGFRFRLLFHGSENLLYMNGSFICGLSMFTYQYNILKPYCVPFPNKSAGEIIIDTYDDNDCDKSFFLGISVSLSSLVITSNTEVVALYIFDIVGTNVMKIDGNFPA